MRTVYATLRQRSFLDYLYFTDYETEDPALYTGSPFTAAQAQVSCAAYAYGSNPRDPNCVNIQFVSGDTINGPMHTNDAFMLCGTPHFNGADVHVVVGSERTALPRRLPDVASRVRQPGRPADRAAAHDAAQRLDDQEPDQCGCGRMPVHGSDPHQTQLERHDDGEVAVLEEHEQLVVSAERQHRAAAVRWRDLRAERAVHHHRSQLHERMPVQRQRPRPPARYADHERHHHLRVPQRRCLRGGNAEGSTHHRHRQLRRCHVEHHVRQRR